MLNFKLIVYMYFSARRKEPIWQRVETVSNEFSADQIVSALVTNSQLSTLVAKDMTAQVDIRRDAQNLRYVVTCGYCKNSRY